MNEWQNLDVNNLPPDILVDGAYLLEGKSGNRPWNTYLWDMTDVLGQLRRDNQSRFRIRRPEGWEPKECPTCGNDDKRAVFTRNNRTKYVLCTDSWHDEPKTPDYETEIREASLRKLEAKLRYMKAVDAWQRAKGSKS